MFKSPQRLSNVLPYFHLLQPEGILRLAHIRSLFCLNDTVQVQLVLIYCLCLFPTLIVPNVYLGDGSAGTKL